MKPGIDRAVRDVRWIFLAGGSYGILSLAPAFLVKEELVVSIPPVITHPEFYYGFFGSALVWQIAFFIIATDPIRFRPLVAVSILEKLAFFGTCFVLFLSGRLAPGGPLLGGAIDGVWMLLFAFAWARIRDRS